ncbi:MAG TPA: nuclear transport factor 2 family protein [Thermoanaerobaculia bacterium]
MRILIALATLLLASTPSFSAEPSDDAIRESLRAAEAGFAKAFADDHLEAFAAYIDDDSTFLGRTPLRGKKAVVAQWAKYFGVTPRPFSWEPERWEVNPSRTMGMTNGPVFDSAGGYIGSFSSVWKVQPDGSWKIIFDGGGECPRRAP